MKLRTLKLSSRLVVLAAMLLFLGFLSRPAPASASFCSHLCENHCVEVYWQCVRDNPGQDCCEVTNACLDSCGDCPRWCF